MSETFAIDSIDSASSVGNSGTDNRRKHSRRMAYWPVSYQALSGKWMRAKTDNVSEGGLQIIADIAYPPGTKLFVKMSLVYREYKMNIEAIVEARYSVASNLGFKTGLMFTRISDQDREFLRAYSEKEI